MKIPNVFLLTFLLFFSVTSCKKKQLPSERRVFGQALEYGTDKPIAGAVVELYSSGTDGTGSSSLTENTVTTDAEGRFEMLFETADISSIKIKADGYFDSQESFLNASRDNDEVLYLDPFAWLSVRVVNEAPAEEFDRINYAGPGAPSNPDNHIGSNIDVTRFARVRGNKSNFLYWWVYSAGILQNENGDTLIVPAHDTLYYDIRY